ncbi:MAG: diguanylate cyclase [Rhodoferax sp.]|uniref:sensor domain-containing diguanylate cyclase n=1 Tax=Rhodoferax sp. TaxID=50421 RepID=UPI001401B220|nr:sensor domain-containing diguanylate cyclase [Rhodoferax sp.]NDP39418.1 diguanylate cyclase [Rhodoferax sp.]
MKHAIHWNLLSPFIRNALLLAGLISVGLAVWSRYGWIVLGCLVALALIVWQGTRLLMTQRRLAEQYRLVLLQKKRLRESEFRWKFAIEGSGDGLWDWNVADGTVFFSAQYKKMLGLTVDEMGNQLQEWETRVHPNDASGSLVALQSHLDGQTPVYATQYRMRCKDGSYKWILDRGMVVSRSDAGKPLRMIGTHTDISAHKEVEDKLQLAASVFTHALEGIMITDAQGVIIDVNQAFSRITGYDRQEVLGRNPHLLSSGRQGKEFYAAMWRDLQDKGSWYGEVWNRRKDGEVYAQLQNISAVRDAQGQTRQYVSLFSDITALKQHQQQLQHLAHFDALTDLPNRLLLADRLHQGMVQVRRRGQVLALAFVDLDGFKLINDRHGHEAGDHLLMTVATRMKQALREGDTLARLGGDEFVAVMLDLADEAACKPMLHRLLAAAAQPLQFGGQVLQVSASLGVTIYPQGQAQDADDIDADQLLRQADQAMYQAKLAGKNCYQFFGAD